MLLTLDTKQVEGLNFQALNKLEPIKKAKDREWFAQRRGKFTASEFHRLMAYPDKSDFPKGAETYVLEKITEELTEVDNVELNTPAMQWGLDHEEDAVLRFIQETGFEVHKYGEKQEFISYKDYAGGTPDGLIYDSMGIEIKCPNSDTHLKYSLIHTQAEFKKICKAYYWQIQGCMLITGRKRWYFVSYDPRFLHAENQIKILLIDYDIADVEDLKRRLEQANALKKEIIQGLF